MGKGKLFKFNEGNNVQSKHSHHRRSQPLCFGTKDDILVDYMELATAITVEVCHLGPVM